MSIRATIERLRDTARSSLLVKLVFYALLIVVMLNAFHTINVRLTCNHVLGKYFQDRLAEKVVNVGKVEQKDILRLSDDLTRLNKTYGRMQITLAEGDYTYAEEYLGNVCRERHLPGYVLADSGGSIVATSFEQEPTMMPTLAGLVRHVMDLPTATERVYNGYADLDGIGLGYVTARALDDGSDGVLATIVLCQSIVENDAYLRQTAWITQMEVDFFRDGVCTATSQTGDAAKARLGKPLAEAWIADSVAASRNVVSTREGLDDEDVFSLYSPIVDYRGNVVGMQRASNDVKLLKEITNQFRYGDLLVGLIFAILSVSLFIVLIKRNVTRPIHGLAEAATRIASGDLTQATHVKRTGDEIQLLGDSMDNMLSELNTTIGGLSQAAKVLSTTSSELKAASQDLSNGATEQAADLEQISSSLEEMTGNLHQNTDNSATTERMMQESHEKLTKILHASQHNMNDTRQISGSLRSIHALVGQTNILSINAAVEAARVGKQGKGFAVVAKEVGRLAEQTKSTARDVGDIAGKSIHGTERINELLSEVMPRVDQVATLMKEIAASSREQGIGADQINTAIMDLNNVTQHTAADAEEIAADAAELADTAQKVLHMVQGFKV